MPGSASGWVKKCCILATLSIVLVSAGLEALSGGGVGGKQRHSGFQGVEKQAMPNKSRQRSPSAVCFL